MEFNPRYRNLVDLFYASVEEYADRPLFGSRVDGAWQWSTYGSFRVLVDRCRSGLARLGVGAGDRVAAISDNRQEWAISAYATYSLGAIYIPMFEVQPEREWKFILQDSGARVCFVANEAIATNVKRLRGDLHSLEKIVTFESTAKDESSFEGLLKLGDQHIEAPKIPDDNAIAAYIYTAQPKGDPIGVMLTHLNLASNSCAIVQNKFRGLQNGDRSLAFLPWAHVFGGFIEINALIATGGSIAICDNIDELFEYLREVRPTVLFSVPRIWEKVFSEFQTNIASRPLAIQAVFYAGMEARAKRSKGQSLTWRDRMALLLSKWLFSPAIQKRLGGRVRYANSGGAALSVKCRAFLNNLEIPVYEGYGLTECSGCATASGPAAHRPGSVGMPLPGIQIKLDKEIPSGNEEEGEIVVYGGCVMKGYHNQPDMTDKVRTADGGLRTGDLGRIDQDGFLYITGNIKDLYKLANGRYVAPASLEDKLRRSPFIAQCLVYGVNRPSNVALIVPDLVSLTAWAKSEGLSPFIDALLKDERTYRLFEDEIKQCSKDFKGFEHIRAFFILEKAFTTADGTLTPYFQVDRRNIIARYQEQIDRLYR